MDKSQDSESKSPSKRNKKHKHKDSDQQKKPSELVQPETIQHRPRAMTTAGHPPEFITDQIRSEQKKTSEDPPKSPRQTPSRSRIERLPADFAPKPDSVVLSVQATVPEMKNAPGYAMITHEALWFQSKQMRNGLLKVRWQNAKEVSKMRKKGLDKAVRVGMGNEQIILNGLKDRDAFLFFARLELRLARSAIQTFGFVRKGDEEVSTRITTMKAPHVFEDSVTLALGEILAKLREGTLINDMLTACGCSDVVPLKWEKTKNGIERMVSYVHPMMQNADVKSVQTLMKSGRICVLEMTETFSRPSIGEFLESNVQFYFKEEDGVVNFRGAYGLAWNKEPWDKEFVEAAVSRVNRMSFYYLKSKFSGETFNVSKYEGKWRMHQPYVLVIGALVLLILCVLILPVDTDWFRIIGGFVVLVFFF